MEKKYINKIIAIIHEQKKEDGWTNLCTLGKYLNENNINYKNWGYLKLKDFVCFVLVVKDWCAFAHSGVDQKPFHRFLGLTEKLKGFF